MLIILVTMSPRRRGLVKDQMKQTSIIAFQLGPEVDEARLRFLNKINISGDTSNYSKNNNNLIVLLLGYSAVSIVNSYYLMILI